MTTNLLILALLATISGCSHIPETESTALDTKATEPIIYSSNIEPSTTVKCITNNIEERLGAFIPMPPKNPMPNYFEVSVRSKIGVAAVINIEPEEKGSRVLTRISNHYPFKKTLANMITKGC